MKLMFERYKILFICGGVILLASFLYFSNPKEQVLSGAIKPDLLLTDTMIPQVNETENLEVDMRMFVDVKGAVHKPGLYEVMEDSRIFDIIEQAGGLLADADERQINFAEKVTDEMVVYIPKIGEILDDMPQMAQSNARKDGKVSINKADSTELETLPGIGPAKAAAIIEYRETNGPYQQIEDLQKISGIGPKSFEKLQDLISVK